MKNSFLKFVFALVFVLSPFIVLAGTGQNMSGWAWADNIGWISFNCTNEDSCATSDYGVNYDSTTGFLTGYAWANPADGTGVASASASATTTTEQVDSVITFTYNSASNGQTSTNGLYTWQVPDGVTKVKVQLWGAGGGGGYSGGGYGGVSSVAQFTGGGGGAYGEVTLDLTESEYNIGVGVNGAGFGYNKGSAVSGGNSTFGTYYAGGGSAGSNVLSPTGGTGVGGTFNTPIGRNGGSGGLTGAVRGCGGGGAGGVAPGGDGGAAGANAGGGGGASANGGNGGRGGNCWASMTWDNMSGQNGFYPGGGGGGGGMTLLTGGGGGWGADGRVIITTYTTTGAGTGGGANASTTGVTNNIGWIQFGNLSLADMPFGNGTVKQNAKMDNSGNLTGWVKALSADSATGWDGWISLSGTGYGVNLTNTASLFAPASADKGLANMFAWIPKFFNTAYASSHNSFAWGSDVVGWIDFSGVVFNGSSLTPAVTITADPTTGPINVVIPKLTWSATNNPTSCTASGDWSGPQPISGTNVSQGVLTQEKIYTYSITCSNANGASPVVSATVDVGVPICGSANNTAQEFKPTGEVLACTYGGYDNPSETPLLWRWKCGNNNCSAEKWVCTDPDDSAYVPGATNDLACAENVPPPCPPGQHLNAPAPNGICADDGELCADGINIVGGSPSCVRKPPGYQNN